MANGPCEFCGRDEGVSSCGRCERRACAAHFDGFLGLCWECSERTRPEGRRGGRQL